MSGLAEILLNRHFTVTGSDMQASDMPKHLEETGAKVVIGQKAENITQKTYPTVKYGRECPYCHGPHTYLLEGNECNIKEIEAC